MPNVTLVAGSPDAPCELTGLERIALMTLLPDFAAALQRRLPQGLTLEHVGVELLREAATASTRRHGIDDTELPS
jgi:hypothetical protein